jgi:hypothetical protein
MLVHSSSQGTWLFNGLLLMPITLLAHVVVIKQHIHDGEFKHDTLF